MVFLELTLDKPIQKEDLQKVVDCLPPSLNIKYEGRSCFTHLHRLDIFIPETEPNKINLVSADEIAGPTVFAIVESKLLSLGYTKVAKG